MKNTSHCDFCSEPGSCCKGFNLSDDNGDSITYWADDKPMEKARAWLKKHNLPFVPRELRDVYFSEEQGRHYITYTYECTWLLDNGKCGNYAQRPELCRNYLPLTDNLCAMRPDENKFKIIDIKFLQS